ncbi:FAD-dependent monooxygenase [Flavobacterium wongokense]|uniref:FAD-dependent monooxygenase n=1 Tax=Flavobacterium wongokense TaxID=2910674 RepID=UPI001F162028|nr:FAD-dependent monooxygenase [Flavobacterium sp. WG47]MCF6133089.1 FAD-dependent monooxygenase [Flavobacterium sp. WG47]
MEVISSAMKNSKTQVVIVGAGPTGLSMAAQLIRYNIDFIIIEKNEKTTHLSKAIVLQARSLEIFQELGIVEEAIRRGQMTTGMNLFRNGKQKAAVDLADLGKGLSDFAFALSLEQSKTEKLLAEFVANNRKQVEWGSELSRFEQHENGVTVYYKDKTGTEHKIEADYLVGCDGAGSVVRHQLDLTFEGSTESKLFYVADVVLQSPVINKNRLYMHLIPKGFVLFFPMEGAGHYRIIGVLPEHTDDSHEYSFAEIEPNIKKGIITPVDFEELRWFSTYKVHSRKADSFRKGNCFIAGDAAHIHTPAGGQGMNTGIQDAYNLAWKMAYTLRGEVNDTVLETYNTERTENAKRLLNTTDRMFDVMSGVNAFWNIIRLAFFPIFLIVLSTSNFVKRKIFPLLSQIGIAYPDSYLTQQSSVGKVKAGDRMHYFIFANGRTIFSYLNEPVFKLLYFGSKPVENPVGEIGITMSFQSFTEIPASVFGNNSEFYILLRPDNHVSYIGNDVKECRNFLNKIKLSEKK